MRIVIFEDEASILELMRAALETLFPDLKVECFSNALKAAEIFADEPVDAVLTDWSMPLAGGDSVISAAIKAGIPDRHLVIISGLVTDEQSLIREMPGLPKDYHPVILSKPARLEELSAVIERIQRVA